jgi:RND family efflux transporter MFP subunit
LLWSLWLVFHFLITSCKPAASPPPEPQDEKTLQATLWGERFEVFLEHQPVVAGSPTRFVTHVSDIALGEPRRAGPLTFVLRPRSGPPLELVAPAPSRPGIYTPEITIPAPGEWTLDLRIREESGESAVGPMPIAVFAAREKAEQAPAPEAPEGISFLKEQQWKLRMTIEPAVRRRMVERLRVAGTVTARPESIAAVTPPLAGRLLSPPSGALPSLGARVEAGQTLALIQPPFADFFVKRSDLEADAIRAKLALDFAELAFARVEKLTGLDLKTARERDEAELALRTARANHDAATRVHAAYDRAGAVLFGSSAEGRGPTDLPRLELKAPIAGIVTERTANLGEHVPAERAVFRILDAEWVAIEAKVPESELYRVAASMDAAYELPGAPGELVSVLRDGAGRFAFLGSVVDARTRTVPLVYEVENARGELRIGMALTVHIETQRAEEALAVPESAIVEEEGQPVVFVQVSGETFEKRTVALGIRDSGFAQVLEGLSGGVRVVTKHAYAIRLASVATSVPAHGHAH